MTILRTWLAATLLGLGAAAVVPSTGSTQDAPRGFYLALGGGFNRPLNSDLNGGGLNAELSYDNGWGAVGALGYALPGGFRVEFELAYRANDTDTFGGLRASGDSTVWSGLVNVVYELSTGTSFSPYAGIGVGGARVALDARPIALTSVDDDDTRFAYQGLIGVAYALGPQLRLWFDYRYFATQDPEFRRSTGVQFDSEYRAHTVMAGIRYLFGPPRVPREAAAPAVTPPAAAPTPPTAAPRAVLPVSLQRNFLVFFDWDRSDLSSEARQAIANAAASAKSGNVARIIATGHADRSGSVRYNQGLSERRAAAVRTELIRLGIPVAQIVIVGKGETAPLVPTADGVREPQNRRVEIVLQ
ncbi:MAG TPA: OmpA family protein [Alphaproteobacteria bacterium]|nr:OmpA family protein [Alphaproteobacteria bacterium]